MPAGRPTKYKKEYCDLLVEDMARGYSYEAFAGLIKVHVDTLYEWEKIHPEFSDAKKAAVAQGRRTWEGWGMDGLWTMTSKEEGSRSMNATLWIFNMKNRFGWRDRQEIETTGSQTLTLKNESMTPQDLKQIAEKDPLLGDDS